MKGKKPTVTQRRWLQDYGIKNTDPYLVQKNTPTLFQIKDTRTSGIAKFKKCVSRRTVTLELITTNDRGKEQIVCTSKT